MGLSIWLMIIAFTSLGIFLIGMTTDIKDILKGLKQGVSKGSKAIDKSLYSVRKSRIGRLIEETEIRIQRANIRVYIPYNIFTHFVICIIFASISFMWMNKHMNVFISLIFGIIGLILPYIILQIITYSMNARVKKYSIDFLIILKNFYNATKGNIFDAFENAKDSYAEPLKTYVDVLVYEYKHKINPLQAMDNFIRKIDSKELKIFMENLKICYTNGGDINALINEFIDETSKLNEDSDAEDTKDKILNFALYILLLFNFGMILYILNSHYRLTIANTFWGQSVFAADLIISIYIIYMTLKKESN